MKPRCNFRVRAPLLTGYGRSEPSVAPLHTEAAPSRPPKELPFMIHDLVLAAVFLGMIIAPALLAMRSGREEKDAL